MEVMSSTEFWLLLACIVLVDCVVVWLYRRIYEYQINRILRDSTRKCKLPEVRKVMITYIVIGAVVVMICVINSIKYSEQEKESCDLLNSTMGFNISDKELEKELNKLHNSGKTESFTLQEDMINDNVSVLYAVKNKKDYIYVITYKLDREAQEDEYIYLDAIYGSTTRKLDSKNKTIRIFFKGKLSDIDCERTDYQARIKNYVKGKNLYPIDEVIEFTVENGGILNEK